MIKWITTLLVSLSLIFSVRSEMIYFWLDNSDLRYQNLTVDSQEYSFTTFIKYSEDGKMTTTELNVKKATASDVGASGNRDARISDFGSIDSVDGVRHWLEEGIGSNGKKSIVYQIDLGNISIDDQTALTFILELDGYNGTDYYGTFMSRDLKDHFMTKDLSHVCGGVTLYPYSVPEPNSAILILIGSSLLALLRPRNKV